MKLGEPRRAWRGVTPEGREGGLERKKERKEKKRKTDIIWLIKRKGFTRRGIQP